MKLSIKLKKELVSTALNKVFGKRVETWEKETQETLCNAYLEHNKEVVDWYLIVPTEFHKYIKTSPSVKLGIKTSTGNKYIQPKIEVLIGRFKSWTDKGEVITKIGDPQNNRSNYDISNISFKATTTPVIPLMGNSEYFLAEKTTPMYKIINAALDSKKALEEEIYTAGTDLWKSLQGITTDTKLKELLPNLVHYLPQVESKCTSVLPVEVYVYVNSLFK